MSTQTQTAQHPQALAGVRGGADAAYGVLGMVTVAAIAVQIGLAGLGAFGGSFGPHLTLGYGIALLTLLMLVASLIARPSGRVVLVTLLLFVLAGPIQPMLATLGSGGTAWLGALHAFDAVIIFGLTGWLMSQARARRTRT
ncbi:MAG: DUF6220 domain-containing protein [Streptosporangiaceae bacterium]